MYQHKNYPIEDVTVTLMFGIVVIGFCAFCYLMNNESVKKTRETTISIVK